MSAPLQRSITSALVVSLLMLTTTVSAQISPAQMKAQRDRATQAAAARVRADRERTAAAARASQAAKARERAAARQRALRAAAERLERARKLALHAEARNQAVASGRINTGYMIGAWAYADPSTCRPDEDADHRTKFYDNGRYSGYEDGGKWAAENGNLIWDYTDPDDNEIHKIEKVVDLSLNHVVTESRGGYEVWFRCGEGVAMIPEDSIPKKRFAEPSYESFGEEYELASEIDQAWDSGRLPEAYSIIERFLAAFSKNTYVSSKIRNYAGLYQWKQVRDLKQAAALFLQNYQYDPAGERGAESLLSLAEVMHEMGDIPQYCLALKQLRADYPFDTRYRLAQQLSAASKLHGCS